MEKAIRRIKMALNITASSRKVISMVMAKSSGATDQAMKVTGKMAKTQAQVPTNGKMDACM